MVLLVAVSAPSAVLSSKREIALAVMRWLYKEVLQKQLEQSLGVA
ncbi:hypothetical protein S7335_756 [Synechococcus sp. PCC 7335]|nr:hypothetical protein S7335_550 [Synechococcus sp. PCC 7335]EDX83576.1 hypothetical protein S7335_756 [Synechococcus sp. PCC 7335]